METKINERKRRKKKTYRIIYGHATSTKTPMPKTNATNNPDPPIQADQQGTGNKSNATGVFNIVVDRCKK